MELDFTLQKYDLILETIKQTTYEPQTMVDYLRSPAIKAIILRHDVDRKPKSALRMAQIEYDHGIHSTYYFRTVKNTFNPEIIRQIYNMEHEIGYHYEVLDKANGNLNLAIKIFQKELEMLRRITPINTICMHGNPLKRWSNIDLWKKYDPRSFGIIGEPYSSIDYSKVTYFTDTGRSWNNRNYSVKDKTDKYQPRIKNGDILIQHIKNEMYPNICILTHPNRWTETKTDWVIELLAQNIKNIGKMCINFYNSKA